MRARYVIDTGRWDLLARERNFGNVNELFAIGMSAARTGNIGAAQLARQGLAERAGARAGRRHAAVIAIMEKQVAALIELAAGRRDRAVEILRAAMDAEQRLPAPLGPPKPVKPAAELLGEVLLEIGRPREAIAPFQSRVAAQRQPHVVGAGARARGTRERRRSRRRSRSIARCWPTTHVPMPACPRWTRRGRHCDRKAAR